MKFALTIIQLLCGLVLIAVFMVLTLVLCLI